VVYAELTGAQHAFDIVPSIRTVHTVEYVERFLHHLWVDHQSASAGGDSEGRTSSGYPSRSGPQGED
jgi:hypothetical protein